METTYVNLEVPFVQEIAKEGLTKVPERFVRPLHQRPILSITNDPLPEIPVIDFSKLLSKDFKELELEKLDYACKEWGFFQLINHGVNTSLVENVKTNALEFFKLPLEEKKKFKQNEGDVEGYGQVVVSEDQILEWADMFFMYTFPQNSRNPHLFPNIPLPFRDYLETYLAEVKEISKHMLDFVANAIGMENKEMKELFGEGVQAMRMNYYPPCPEPELVIGLNPHSDAGGLTILLHCNDVEGLHLRNDGLWIPIKPLPNAFTINVGDMIEIMTNGIYRSIEHRTVVNSEKDRLSLATFYNPSMEVIIGPASSLVTPKAPARYKTISVPDYYKGYLSKELRGKSHLDHMRIHTENEKNLESLKI
ncbi:hypothetical protein TanjilG_09698 [Lupinus angustifolius]|uniref:Fe2OG dioxygenase domain-containing protein n=1 Tax=Lupinus angustifolius TaxID=3871 RepID=A0A4P1R420_LUPAN|nr:PREDICTED: protein SRG1-like [Lupinus angustifolius]OIW00729.1 hypothetical protein TanjilG_09698 [Lupinus angustifolius]